MPLLIMKDIWLDLTMDFMLGLMCSRTGRDSILVVIDRFTKIALFFACKRTEDDALVTHLFFQEVVYLHGVQKTIISNKDVKSISKFWRHLWDNFSIQLQFSSAFHPQINSQTKVITYTLGNTLHCAYGDKQWNWKVALPQVKFLYNSKVNQFIGKIPFEIVYSYFLCHVCDLAVMPLVTGGKSKAADNEVEKALQIHVEVQAQLELASTKYKADADKHRRKKVF